MKHLEYIEDLIPQIEEIFAHGPSRAKNHDQRLGQYIINKLYKKHPEYYNDAAIVRHLFNIENQEFLDLIKDYND